MQLFIEQDFLDKYYNEFDKYKLSAEKKILDKFFSEYTELEIYLDCKTNEEIEDQFKQNSILKKILTNNPAVKAIGRFENYFADNFKHKQALVFLRHKSEWSEALFNKGVLCFFYDTYEERLKDIINELHFRIDLSERINPQFKGWAEFKKFKVLPLNSMVVSDKFVLSDKTGQEIDKNLIPLLKNILEEKQETNIEITILTDKILENANRDDKNIKEREKVKKRHKYLNSRFAQYKIKFSIIKILTVGKLSNFELHDRIVYTNYSILEIGKGLNLSRNISNDNLKSNSEIRCETIFDKYTYNRYKNHLKMLSNYFASLKSLNHAEKPFKYYPDKLNNTLFN